MTVRLLRGPPAKTVKCPACSSKASVEVDDVAHAVNIPTPGDHRNCSNLFDTQCASFPQRFACPFCNTTILLADTKAGRFSNLVFAGACRRLFATQQKS